MCKGNDKEKGPIDINEVRLQRELDKHPDTMFGISGWKQLGGTLPGGNHGHGCQCWSCLSQLEDPPIC